MMDGENENPPRNGEGDRAKRGGGVEQRRVKHRTVGASDESIRLARTLRRSMSLPEVLLWRILQTRPQGFKFRKQHPVCGYVADFACLDRRLLIEVDGDNHSYGDRPQRDAMRDQALAAEGFETLRIAASEVLKNMEGVITHIVDRCAGRPLHHSAPLSGPPPRSGEGLA